MAKDPTVLVNPFLRNRISTHGKAFSDALQVLLNVYDTHQGLTLKLDHAILGAWFGHFTWVPTAEFHLAGKRVLRVWLPPRRPYFFHQVKAETGRVVEIRMWQGWRYFFSQKTRVDDLSRFLETEIHRIATLEGWPSGRG